MRSSLNCAASAVITGVFICLIAGCDTLPFKLPAALSDGRDTRIPFTDQIRAEWNLTDDEVKSLQFYIGQTVVLTRAVSDGSKSVAKGKLVLRSGQYINEIEIAAGTPGIATIVSSDEVGVCFDASCSTGTTLGFGCKKGCTDNWQGRYSSLAQSWEKNVGQVNYGGQTYSMSPATFIQIDKDALAKVQKNRRVLPGRRIDSN